MPTKFKLARNRDMARHYAGRVEELKEVPARKIKSGDRLVFRDNFGLDTKVLAAVSVRRYTRTHTAIQLEGGMMTTRTHNSPVLVEVHHG